MNRPAPLSYLFVEPYTLSTVAITAETAGVVNLYGGFSSLTNKVIEQSSFTLRNKFFTNSATASLELVENSTVIQTVALPANQVITAVATVVYTGPNIGRVLGSIDIYNGTSNAVTSVHFNNILTAWSSIDTIFMRVTGMLTAEEVTNYFADGKRLPWGNIF